MKAMKLVSIALAGAAALAAQGPPPGHGPHGPMFGGPMGPPKVITGAPYSASQQIQFQQTLADGNQIQRAEENKVYRDSQGRVRTEATLPARPGSNGATHTVITIFDPVAGYVAHLNPDKQTAMKMTLPATPAARPTPPAPPNVTKQDLGTQSINGLAATGTRITETIPAGAFGNQQPIIVTREVWVSTALSVPVLVKSTDPRHGSSTMQLTDISRSEPDASLFQIPSTYTVSTRTAPTPGEAPGPPPGPGE
jgi:hypothetical protein